MKIEDILSRVRPRRKVSGVAAALLPFNVDGSIAVEAFQHHLRATQAAGLDNAVNMDTGYVNYLSDTEKQDVLRWAREALGQNVPFVAGAYITITGGAYIGVPFFSPSSESKERWSACAWVINTASIAGSARALTN